jgi:molybdate transport system substrate-binding protein
MITHGTLRRMAVTLAFSLVCAHAAAPEPMTVFGAASLTDVLTEIGVQYRSVGHDVRFSFAASSTLARQIEAGAPAHVYVSASEDWMDYLQFRQLIDPSGRVSPVGNGLVAIAPAAETANLDLADPASIARRLGLHGRIAMADPAHVPAGSYARQALESLGVWPTIQGRAAFADNVRGVLALVERRETALGIVYTTDAVISERVRIVATFPAASYDPIRYGFALTTTEHPQAADLLAFMTGKRGMEIFRRHGFAPL